MNLNFMKPSVRALLVAQALVMMPSGVEAQNVFDAPTPAGENTQLGPPASGSISGRCGGGTGGAGLSGSPCSGQIPGSGCRVASHAGQCVIHGTCLGGECCGCRVGAMVFLGGGIIGGADGRLYTAEGAVLEAPGTTAAELAEAERSLDKERAVAFRVYDSEGNAVDGAEVIIRATAPSSFTFNRRGTTVNGLFQTFVACRGSQPNWPSQILYAYEVWSAAGTVYKNSWWQSAGGWTCDTTKDLTVRLQPPLDGVDLEPTPPTDPSPPTTPSTLAGGYPCASQLWVQTGLMSNTSDRDDG